jgi:hypothetical protein
VYEQPNVGSDRRTVGGRNRPIRRPCRLTLPSRRAGITCDLTRINELSTMPSNVYLGAFEGSIAIGAAPLLRDLLFPPAERLNSAATMAGPFIWGS